MLEYRDYRNVEAGMQDWFLDEFDRRAESMTPRQYTIGLGNRVDDLPFILMFGAVRGFGNDYGLFEPIDNSWTVDELRAKAMIFAAEEFERQFVRWGELAAEEADACQ